MHSSREDVINFEISLVHRLLGELSQTAVSDFLTNGYGSSWDSTCEKLWVPVPNHWVPVPKKQWVLNWKCLVLYATRQLIWRQTPKLCIKVYWNKSILLLLYSTTKTKRNCVVKQQPQEWLQKSHKQDVLQKHLQTDRSIFASYGTPVINYFTSFCWDLYALGAQDSEVTKSRTVR